MVHRRVHMATTIRRGALGAGLLVVVAALAGCGDHDASTADTAAPVGVVEAAATQPAGNGAADDAVASGAAAVIDPGDGGVWEPDLDPADFVDRVDNPYLPLLPGARWVYEGSTDEGVERVEVVVTDERREILGISATVVRDTVTVDGVVVEDTYDWFAQDVDGTVWYLGEESTDYEDGELVGHEGSWEAGIDGAQPGIVMPGDPVVGHAYRQELLVGEAEDLGEILAVDGTVTVPAGTYDAVLTTRDWNPLEPDVVEQKQYAPGVGLVREEVVQGGDDVVELLSFEPGA
jgi:hypothetical protein